MHPVQVRDVQFLRANTSRRIKVTVPGPFTMSQQAQNDAYESDAELALAYAAAVHDEIVDLFAAGADIVQIDEPYMQARPEKARELGLAALERALDGVVGTTAVHICFGYAAIIHERPSAYSFLPEMAACSCDEISIETAQSGLDTSILETLPDKRIILGVINLDDMEVESPETVAARIRRALPYKRPERARRGDGLRDEVPAARRRLRQARVARRGCGDRAGRDGSGLSPAGHSVTAAGAECPSCAMAPAGAELVRRKMPPTAAAEAAKSAPTRNAAW